MDQEQFVARAHDFMKVLAEYYGAERGHEFWVALAPVVGEDIQREIFVRMLKSEPIGVKLSFRGGSGVDGNRAVEAIKAIREATGYGLKPAKDAWDAAKIGNLVHLTCLDSHHRFMLMNKLQSIGFHVL